ncbi:hypothetical protein L2E82_20516 [Cichorium intybus]|uniref:Uncharacterized protein n=1 Tax=Cichorium intybus TaxID=13427 RepID=A0ACB9DTW7_CICIN|nr:hypothetical protein L2E82_20516 [Cichorium intybus]
MNAMCFGMSSSLRPAGNPSSRLFNLASLLFDFIVIVAWTVPELNGDRKPMKLRLEGRGTASGATNQAVFIAIWASLQLFFIFIKELLASTTIRTRDESNIATSITDLPWPNCTNRKPFQKVCKLTSLVKLLNGLTMYTSK